MEAWKGQTAKPTVTRPSETKDANPSEVIFPPSTPIGKEELRIFAQTKGSVVPPSRNDFSAPDQMDTPAVDTIAPKGSNEPRKAGGTTGHQHE